MGNNIQQSGPLSRKTEVLELDQNIAAMVAYTPVLFINLISSIIWLNTEKKDNEFLRFHAAQSLVMCGGFIAIALLLGTVTLLLGWIPLLGAMTTMVTGLLWSLSVLAFVVVNVLQMIEAHKGRSNRLPIVGQIADSIK